MKPSYAFYDNTNGYIRAAITLIIGIVMVAWPEAVKKYIVTIIGSIVLLMGVISIIIAYAGKWKEKTQPLITLNSVFNVAFGLVLLVFPNFFADFVVFVFGILLIIFALFEIIGLVKALKEVRLPWQLFIGPVVTLTTGIVLLCRPDTGGNLIFILFGSALIVYSVSEFLSTYRIRSLLKKSAPKAGETFVKDIPYEETGRKG